MRAAMAPEILYAGGTGSPGRQTNIYLAPSMDTGGRGLLDNRVGYNQTRKGAIGIGIGSYRTLRANPATKAAANIAALAHVVSGTPMTLVSTTGAGVSVLATALTVWGSGNIAPVNALALDGAPGLVNFGAANPSGLYPLSWYDWTLSLARCVSVTGVAAGSGGTILVSGADLYGYPQTQLMTLAAGVNTVNSTKAFKFIYSVVPQFTDANNVSVGTADIFGFPMRADNIEDVTIWWGSALQTANTGFVAAVTTSPSTNLLGDVRGTYAVQSASDGTKILSFMQLPGLARSVTSVGVWGVTPV
jgi:hypothetical protein